MSLHLILPDQRQPYRSRRTPFSRVGRTLPTALIVVLSALIAGCRENPVAAEDPAEQETSKPIIKNPDWSEATHGEVKPNYAVVFPQDAVNQIEITMTAAQWAAVRANMRTLFGYDFGAGGTGGGGGGGAFPASDPDYVAVTVRFNGKQWNNVGFRLKGNSSLTSSWRQGNYKLPFRLNFDWFEDQFPGEKNQRFYGFDELSMSSGFSDNSLIHEKLASDVFRLAGVPAARTAFYRVYIDIGQGLKYFGLYTMVEVVDDTMVEDQFGSDTGNLYKPESRFDVFNQAQFEKKNNENPPSWADVQQFIAALNSPLRSTSPAQWRSGLEATFDVDHYVKYLAINNAIVNWDAYGVIAHNYYLYNHPNKRITWIPWDNNEAFAGSPGITGTVVAGGGGPGGAGGQGNRALSLSMNEVAATWPLLRYVADDPIYFQRYKDNLRTFSSTIFTEATLDGMIDRYHNLIAPFVVGANGEQPGYSLLSSATAFNNSVNDLKTHVRNRRALISTFAP